MNYAELVQEVYDLTKRPDLVAETESAVRAATIKAHQTDFYSKDIFETGVSFDSADYTQSLDYITLITNFRALSYLRRVESATDTDGTFFNIITPHDVLDSYGQSKTNIAYVAGRVLEIRASVEFQYMLMGCYVNPIVRSGAYVSWVSEQHPYAIIREAARVIFKSIGFDEQSRAYEILVAEEYLLLKMSGLTDVGY